MGFLDKLLGRGKQLADQGMDVGKKLADEGMQVGKKVAEGGMELAGEAKDRVTGHSHDDGHSHDEPSETPAEEPPAPSTTY